MVSPVASYREVRAALCSQMESLSRALFNVTAKECKKVRHGIRIGTIEIVTHGRKRGAFYDFGSGSGGGPVQLIQHELGLKNWREAADWAREWLGWPSYNQDTNAGSAEAQADRLKAQEARRKADEQAWEEDKARVEIEFARRIAKAHRIWERSTAIAGTPAEIYLTRTRKIVLPIGLAWPDSIRFDPVNPSLVIRGVDKNGATVCVQCVGLTDDGNKRAFWGKVSKQTLGRATGVGALLSGVAPEYENVVLFAEGPETGLTAWAATGIATKIAFGSFAKLEPDAGLLTCILRDDDPARVERSNGNEKKTVRNPSHLGIRKAVENWRNRGLRVIDCDPWPIRRSDKSDFNDMAKAYGMGAVRERILLSVRYAQTWIKLPTAPLEEARIQTDHIAADFLRRALSERSEAFTLGAKIDLGVGKTHSALANCRLALKEMRAAGDERVVVFAVPDHKLGGEVADRFNQEEDGLRAAVFRGRQAIDPFS